MLIISLSAWGLQPSASAWLPTYEHIGMFAPILLVALRFLQGMAVGANGAVRFW